MLENIGEPIAYRLRNTAGQIREKTVKLKSRLVYKKISKALKILRFQKCKSAKPFKK